jgi:NAD(P)-dependent dehydrogenase (short-subunit alcohol dehydrogenase family)
MRLVVDPRFIRRLLGLEVTVMETRKTAVITGATSGLGEAAALLLAREGYRVLAVGRDAERGADVVRRARDAGGDADFLAADLFSRADIERLAGEIRERAPRLDLLVNNAGGSFGERVVTKDGFERTFALNVAAPYALVEALLDPLAAARGRVVNVVTGVPRGARATLDELVGARAKGGMGSYIRAKLALLALTRAWQKRVGGRGVTFVALHPGIIPGTRFGSHTPAWLRAIMEGIAKLFRLASTLDVAAGRYLRVATGPVEGGGFYYEGALRPPPKQADDEAFAGDLRAALAQAVRA